MASSLARHRLHVSLTAAAIGALERGVRRRDQTGTVYRLGAALGLTPAELEAFAVLLTLPAGTRANAPSPPRAIPPTSPPKPRTTPIGREREIAAMSEATL